MKKRILGIVLSSAIILGSLVPNISYANDRILNVERIAGSNRIETAVKVSRKNFRKSENAIIASGEDFPDALVGGTLATQIEAPILLVGKNSLPKEVSNELKRLEVDKVYLLGGKNSISVNVEDNIGKSGIEVHRLAGKDRVETAGKIADLRYRLMEITDADNFVSSVNGYKFADSLAAAPFVGQFQIKTKKGITLNELYPTNIDGADMVFGGINSVPSSVGEKHRFAGSSREETAVKVAEGYKTFLNKDIDTIVLVDGYKFPDALASAPVAAVNNGAILLTNSKKLSKATKEFIYNNKNIENIIIIGGENSVSKSIERELKSKINGNTPSMENEFDKLDKGLQAFLMTSITDERVFEYRNLDHMMFFYDTRGDYYYSFITSGVGSGHPMNKYKVDGNNIIFMKSVVLIGATDIETRGSKGESTTKEKLYEEYLRHKDEYDKAVGKMEITKDFDIVKVIEEN